MSEASGWHPIADAPRDGSWIIIAAQHRRDGHWFVGGARGDRDADGEGWRWGTTGVDDLCEFHPPEVWQRDASDAWPPRRNRYGELEGTVEGWAEV